MKTGKERPFPGILPRPLSLTEKISISGLLFNEITKKAVLDALHHPGKLQQAKYEAQQARRILDRLVGYQVSPILWEKVRRGLSAGRVQSVAVRIICEREREIQNFVSEEYWSLTATLKGKDSPASFDAKLTKWKGKKVRMVNEAEALTIKKTLETFPYTVLRIVEQEKRRHPFPPIHHQQTSTGGLSKALLLCSEDHADCTEIV
jgi:DNA topoisomerase-1